MFSINVLIWSLSTSTDLPNHGAPPSEKSPAWNVANHFRQDWSVTAPSPHTAQIFIVFQLRFSLSWNKAQYAKMLPVFFHLQYQNGYTKIHQFWCLKKKMHPDMTAATIQSNKLFQMKLQTRATRAILQKNPNYLANPYIGQLLVPGRHCSRKWGHLPCGTDSLVEENSNYHLLCFLIKHYFLVLSIM